MCSRRSALAAGIALAAASCGSGTGDALGPAPPDSTAPAAPISSTTATAPPPERPAGGDDAACRPAGTTSGGRVEREGLTEASGLAASRRHDGVLWTHNDSGSGAGLFAIDLDGRDLGFFALIDRGAPVEAVDVEDIAIAGDTLYLADIGDNSRRRASVTVYVVDEPDPGTDGIVELQHAIEFTYPDGPTDAEALLVDPEAGELLILSKYFDQPAAPTRLYTVPLSARSDDGPVEATSVGQLDVAALTGSSNSISMSALLLPGLVTGADGSPTGDLVAIRTYGSAWLFRRSPGQTLAQALTEPTVEPCEGGAAAEPQGEAIALLPERAPDGEDTVVRYATVGEGRARPVNLTSVVVGG